jgi:hypothetical protein
LWLTSHLLALTKRFSASFQGSILSATHCAPLAPNLGTVLGAAAQFGCDDTERAVNACGETTFAPGADQVLGPIVSIRIFGPSDLDAVRIGVEYD